MKNLEHLNRSQLEMVSVLTTSHHLWIGRKVDHGCHNDSRLVHRAVDVDEVLPYLVYGDPVLLPN